MSFLSRFAGPVAPGVPVYRDVWPALPRPAWIPLPGVRLPGRRRGKQQAAITFVNGSSATGAASGVSVTKPAGVTTGDVLVLAVGQAGNPSLTTANFGTLYAAQRQSVAYKIAGGSEPASYTITWSGGSGNCVVTMTAYRGCDSDPIMAWRGWESPGNDASPHQLDPVYFLRANCAAVAHVSKVGNNDCTPPSGFTNGAQNGIGAGGGSWRGEQAYRVFTAQTGLSGFSWTSPGGTGISTFMLVLRESGETALSLKAVALAQGGSAASSQVLNMPPGYAVGDLIVVLAYYRLTASGSLPGFNVPTSYSRKGTDQLLSSSEGRCGTAVFYKVANGTNDAVTLTTTASVTYLGGYTMAWSSGSAGDDPTMPGTAGQANDTTADLVHPVPAMTLEDYAESNFLIAFGLVQRSGTIPSPVGGFDQYSAFGTGAADRPSTHCSVKLNSGANPAGQNFTQTQSYPGMAWQMAVALVVEGAPSPDATGMSVTWVG